MKNILVFYLTLILLSKSVVVCAGYSINYQQTPSVISGVVKDSEGTLAGVNIIIKGTTQGTVSDIEGKYTIEVQSGDVLVFSFVGYDNVERTIGSESEINVTMVSGGELLEELVVTGVASGTSVKKLGYSITKVDSKLMEEVPSVDAASSLRGRVSGINIIQSSGERPATVTLRGAKSVFSDKSTPPLILIDGMLTNQSLGDINTSDIESIEVIKGAAASSMYGSRAAGGVIQVITKKGELGENNLYGNIRTEVGFNTLGRKFPVNDKHGYKTNSDGTLLLDKNGKSSLDSDHGRFDKSYQSLGLPLFDTFDRTITNAVYQDYTFSLMGGGNKYKFYTGAQLQDRGGIVDLLGSDKRKTIRANFDFYPKDKLSIGFRSSYSTNDLSGSSPTAGAGLGSFWGMVLRYEPFVDVLEKESNGDYKAEPSGAKYLNITVSNFFYGNSKRVFRSENQRFVGGINLTYDFTDDFSVQLKGASDRYYSEQMTYYPKGFKVLVPGTNKENGIIQLTDIQEKFNSASIQLNYSKNITEKINGKFTGKFLIENQSYVLKSMEGYNLTTSGVFDISQSATGSRDIKSTRKPTNTQNFFFSADLDFDDKIIFSGLVRRDGSSRFGEKERWQTFFRTSLAYRITQDFTIDKIDEFKIRASYGTAGLRPPFNAQYEIANIKSGTITFENSGNPNLKPSINRELELGADIDFLNRFNLNITYSHSTIENDFITYNLPKSASPFNQQIRNLGALVSKTFEVSLGANIMETDNFKWDSNLTFDTSNSKITDLGKILPFITKKIYRVEVGEDVGTMYGNYIFTSLDELEVDEQGIVTNAYNKSNLTKDDFVVNNMGYVVEKAKVGEKDEEAIFWKDKNGNKGVRKIGQTQPNFKMGLVNTFSIRKKWVVFTMFDYKNGGHTYNRSNQALIRANRSALLTESSEKGHHFDFVKSDNSLYNSYGYVNAFVESSSYLTLREVAISYTWSDPKILEGIIKSVKFSVIGRNLLTVTNYTGFNPEVWVEDFNYPLYRTFSFVLNFKF